MKQTPETEMKARIEDLEMMPNAAVYRRDDGRLYLKLNERFHVETKLVDGMWKGAGMAEEFAPQELVEIVLA